jgi:hypothetical protein
MTAIFWLSFSILLLELALIRYIPSYFRMLGFFSNYVLLSCFFGMSLGMLRPNARNLFALSLPLAGLAVGLVTWFRPGANLNFGQANVLFFGQESLNQSTQNYPFVVVLVGFFVLFSTIFYGLGQELSRRLSSLPSLRGYSLNLWGSVLGSATFTLLSANAIHPAWWFLLAGLALIPCWPRSTGLRLALLLGMLLPAGMAVLDQKSIWSPYSRLEVRATLNGATPIFANGISHQQMFAANKGSGYAVPFLAWNAANRPPAEVVIVGAGSGNDVSSALDCGVKHVDAVEIDPVINRIGVAGHPSRPYQDPRTSIHITDGRRFLRTSDKKVDIVAFALVDSLTLLSGFGSTRLESNLFTQDSFGDAKALLRPGGMLVVYNDFRESWLVARYYHHMVNLFGPDKVLLMTYPPRARLSLKDGTINQTMAILVAGDVEPVRNWLKGQQAILETQFDDTYRQIVPATDDWPFPYLRQPAVPSHNIMSSFLLLGLSGLSLFVAMGGSVGHIQGRMFWLGAGFMLIETRGIGRVALLFGTSWWGSALAILSVLLLALLANSLSERFDMSAWRKAMVVGLLACLALDALIPTAQLLVLPFAPRLLASLLILFSPMLFSGLLFSQALRQQSNAAEALGSNLLGAMLGGTLENLTTVLGMKGMLLVAAAIYLIAARSR